ncbi:MAG TPA: phage portal protein [Chloroflexota bacterium]|nr:phage portal protein [Chloroflexota bacterium]
MSIIPFAPFGRPVARTRAQALALDDSARLQRYRDYLAFYEGQHYLTPRRGRSSLVANYARTIVDKGVSFLIGRGVGFAVEAPSPPAPSQRERARPPLPLPLGEGQGEGNAAAAEALLYAVYDDNDLDVVDLACATNAGVLGDGVYKVFWEPAPTHPPSPPWEPGGGGRIRVVSVDPLGFFARWRADDLATLQRVDLAYCIARDDADALYASPPSLVGRGAGGVGPSFSPLPSQGRGVGGVRSAGGPEVEVVETWTDAAFRLEVDGRVVREGPNPYGVIPFVHVPNLPGPNEFWGRSDLADVIPLNRELNERLSDQADVIRYHADPPVVFRGVEDHDAITVGPGSVWDLPRDADVKLLEWQGQSVAVQDHINQILRALYETAETPRTAFGDSGRLLSGVALETELRPLIQKTLRKRIVWSAALRRRARLIWQVAESMGLAAPGTFAGLRPRIVWPSMMPQDDTQEVRNNVALVAAGLRSRQTAMDALGTESPEAELARLQAERQLFGAHPAAPTDAP